MSVGLHVCMCTAHVSDANRVRRGLQMPPNRSHGVIMWVSGIKPRVLFKNSHYF